MEIGYVYVISLRRALFVSRDICRLRKHNVFTADGDSGMLVSISGWYSHTAYYIELLYAAFEEIRV
jgi:hypothetical protein